MGGHRSHGVIGDRVFVGTFDNDLHPYHNAKGYTSHTISDFAFDSPHENLPLGKPRVRESEAENNVIIVIR